MKGHCVSVHSEEFYGLYLLQFYLGGEIKANEMVLGIS